MYCIDCVSLKHYFDYFRISKLIVQMNHYSPIALASNAFGHCLVRVRMLHHLQARLAYSHYAIGHAYNAANTCTRQRVGTLKPKSYSLVEGYQTIAYFWGILPKQFSCTESATLYDDCTNIHFILVSLFYDKQNMSWY